ncbi:uncharacterized protein LOC123298113 [Chrysoperla carnea]|uniref:uncharacterized protein LOC123298113 n=1 Tax=Chrysoperla carnea TaxID=189513 RepID=UPI001D082C7A|nr:uncharacterized protein LOC123298113 [Chrysoperla carnea]
MIMTKVQKIIPPITMLDKRITNVHCTEIGCNGIFKSKSNLNMHLLRHHKKEILQPIDKEIKMEYHCPVENCMYNINRDQYFNKFKLLKQHYLKVHCSKEIICTKCNKAFTTAVNMKEHEKYCGIEFYCLSCSNKYTSYEALRTHTKRKGHGFKEKKAYLDKMQTPSTPDKTTILYTDRILLPKIETKSSNEIGIQTDFNCCKFKQKRILLRKRSISSQTNENRLKTIETQTSGDHILKRAMEQADIPLLITKRMNNQDMHTQTTTITAEKATEPLLTQNTLLANSNTTFVDGSNHSTCYSLTVDANLEDLWNDSGTQTSPQQNVFDNITQSQRNDNYLASNCFMGNYEIDQETINENKFCTIETQTDMNSLFNENSLYPFSNMCTQTANTTLLDLELNDIETQTAWPIYRDDYLVSTETQTSSFVTEFNHTETQTDLGLSPLDVS